MSTPDSNSVGGMPSPRNRIVTGEGTRPSDSSTVHLSPDDSPGLPGFRTWRGVYTLVLVVFAAVVIALTVFTRIFS